MEDRQSTPSNYVIDPNVKIAGKTQTQLADEWWKYANSIPQEDNPALEMTGDFAGANQSGDVYYLSGSFNNSGAEINRTIVVPEGKSLFFPIVGSVTLGNNIDDTSDSDLPLMKLQQDNIEVFNLTIDGKPVLNLSQAPDYRQQTLDPYSFDFNTPENSTFAGTPYDNAFLSKSYTDGYYVGIKPLSPGKHTISFQAKVPQAGYYSENIQNITYTIDVKPFNKDIIGNGNNNTLIGNGKNDNIDAFGGNDTVYGYGGDKDYALIQDFKLGSIAQELFFRIQSGEQSFAEIALDYSQGVHAQNAGILGPLLLRELTPGIREIVEQLKPGELSRLFRVDDYYTFFRLDEREPAQLNDRETLPSTGRMYQFLLDELFSTWLESQISIQVGLTSEDVPLEKFHIPPERLLDRLSKSKLFAKYLQAAIIEETLGTWESSPAFESIRDRVNIDTSDRQAALLELYKQTEFSRLVRSRFLARKSQLDRVLFSAIQVRDLYLAQELYCRIKDENQSFMRLATRYSDSPAAKRGGVIGPISILQLYPLIQHHLIGLQPKQLSPIFQLEEHYIFLRLDRSLPVKFTPEIEQHLLDELFEEWLQQKILDRQHIYKSIA